MLGNRVLTSNGSSSRRCSTAPGVIYPITDSLAILRSSAKQTDLKAARQRMYRVISDVIGTESLVKNVQAANIHVVFG